MSETIIGGKMEPIHGGEMINGKSIDRSSNDTKTKFMRILQCAGALLLNLAAYAGIFFAVVGLAYLYSKYLGSGDLNKTMLHIGIVAISAWVIYFVNMVTGFVYIEKKYFKK